jgi:hypothetical protein
LAIWAPEAGATTGRPSKVTRSPGLLPLGGTTNFTTEWSGDEAHATYVFREREREREREKKRIGVSTKSINVVETG